jgi:outer membrane beta-barrel protein
MAPTRCLAPALGLAIALGPVARAAEPQAQVVQERRFQQTHEVSASFGVLPLDAFEKGITFGGAYTWHPSSLFGWEVVHFRYALGVETRLNEELAALSVGPTPFETVQFYGTSNLVFKPVYGKLAVLNRQVIWSEAFVTLGAGVGRLTVTTRPVLEAGLGVRVYGGKRFSARVDIRDALFLSGNNAQNELWLAVGLSVDLGKKP